MPTECSAEPVCSELFAFGPVEGRAVVAGFDGGAITSDAGALLLGAADRAIGLVGRFSECFIDRRRPELVEHLVPTLVGQRIFGIALGYEDLNDHDELRHDPVMAVLAGKLQADRTDCAPVAGKSTLNRLELSREVATRYHKIAHNPAAIEALFVTLFLEAHKTVPREIVIDLDATDDPLHGHQEGRFFHGYYDSYCYLPLYIFSGRHLLAAKLRPANIDASAGSVEEIARIVAQIRARWSQTRIILRADSGPPQAPQDRRAHHHQRSPYQIRHGVRLSLQGYFCNRASRACRGCRRYLLSRTCFSRHSRCWSSDALPLARLHPYAVCRRAKTRY
jgi:hypothetical protein